MRSRSALASAGVTPGLSRASALQAEAADGFTGRVEPHGDDDVELRRHVEEPEIARHDADDLRRPPVDDEIAPERRRVAAETALRRTHTRG